MQLSAKQVATGQISTRHRQSSRLRVLAELGAAALGTGSVERFMGAASEAVARELRVDRVGVFEPTSGHEPGMQLCWGSGWGEADVGTLTVPARALLDPDGPRVHGGAGRTEPLLPMAMLTGIAVPVVGAGSLQGALGCFCDDLGRTFGQDEITFAAAVAELLGAAIAHAKIEQALTSSEQRLAMAQRIAHMGSYDWHIASDTNVWSDELYQIYGTEPQSFNASYERFLSFVHPDDRERIVAVHRRALETGEPYQMEERIVRPDGEVRILESNGEVIRDEAGRPVRMIGICFDVTEQRVAEEAARRYREMEESRRRAFEINDSVVQGLATAVYALERRRVDLALGAVQGTLSSVRDMVSGLLADVADAEIAPGILRRAEPPAAHVRAEETPAANRAMTPHVRVVVADDSDDMRLLLKLSLGQEDCFEVVGEASTGAEALAIVDALRPDLLILDLAMPAMDGLEVVRELRARAAPPVIVVMSGFDAGRLAPAALREGAALYVEKGTPMVEVIADLARLFPTGDETSGVR